MPNQITAYAEKFPFPPIEVKVLFGLRGYISDMGFKLYPGTNDRDHGVVVDGTVTDRYYYADSSCRINTRGILIPR